MLREQRLIAQAFDELAKIVADMPKIVEGRADHDTRRSGGRQIEWSHWGRSEIQCTGRRRRSRIRRGMLKPTSAKRYPALVNRAFIVKVNRLFRF